MINRTLVEQKGTLPECDYIWYNRILIENRNEPKREQDSGRMEWDLGSGNVD